MTALEKKKRTELPALVRHASQRRMRKRRRDADLRLNSPGLVHGEGTCSSFTRESARSASASSHVQDGTGWEVGWKRVVAQFLFSFPLFFHDGGCVDNIE